jgi:DNA-binding MarR family transcriptional regulator
MFLGVGGICVSRGSGETALPIFPLDNHRCNDYYRGVSSRNQHSRTAPLEDRVFVAILKAADALGAEAEQLLKAAGLTGAQYNVLRILRGAEPEGLACRAIGDRMISRDPDVTRLLDRMEKHEWVTRQRQSDDRRVVKTRITKKGLELMKPLDQPVHELHKRQFREVSGAQLKLMAEWLERLAPKERE